MSLRDRIREVEREHQALRAEPPCAANLPLKAEVFRGIKALLDELWAAAPPADMNADAAAVLRAIRLLTVDAEHHAGLSDTEGFRDADEVLEQYRLLERAFA